MEHAPGSLQCLVHLGDADGVWVSELWRSKEDHDASLSLPGSPELIAEASRFSWQTEFGALSFSDRGLEGVIEYVSRQRERHAANDLYPALEMCGERDRTSGSHGTKGPS